MSSRDVKSWQLFGIISGFCTFYALFLPFKYIESNELIDSIVVHDMIFSVIVNISNYVLTESISASPLEYILNYVILISLIIMIFSAIMILWTSISQNIFICILSCFIYVPLSFSFILYSTYTADIVSYGWGFHLLVVGMFNAFIIPFVYSYKR